MKLTIFKLLLMVFVFSSTAMAAKSYIFDPELSGEIYGIERLNIKKKIIKFEGVEIYYDSSTQFFDGKGNKISSENLRSNSVIRFEINPSKKYISRPTATKIWIL